MPSPLQPGGIRLQGVSRRFRVVHDRNATLKETILRRKRAHYTELWALRDVDLSIAPGESLAIVGRNGSGKSTLLKVLAGILPPHAGTVTWAGSISSMLELGAGFHPDFSGRENVYLNAAIYGLTEREVTLRMDDIVAFAELSDYIDMPVRTYSSGMQMRLAFSVASHVRPDILLLDEVLAVGDEAFQRKCVGRMFEFLRGGGTLVFVSHDPGAVTRICQRAILLEAGRVVEDGPAADVMDAYHRSLVSQQTDDGTTDGAARPTAGPQHPLGGVGTGEATIDNLALRSRDQRVSGVMTGDPLEVVLETTIHNRIDDIVAGVALVAEDGSVLFGTTTADSGVDLRLAPGRHTMTLAIPHLDLRDVSLTVNVALHSESQEAIYHWINGAATLEVFSDGPGTGVIDLRPSWQIG
jgi:ABC-type polysaccharide/polyol phosphate transport system ATPase subunit